MKSQTLTKACSRTGQTLYQAEAESLQTPIRITKATHFNRLCEDGGLSEDKTKGTTEDVMEEE